MFQSLFEDVRMAIESNKRWSETERDRIEHQMSQLLELNNSITQTKQVDRLVSDFGFVMIFSLCFMNLKFFMGTLLTYGINIAEILTCCYQNRS